MICAIRFYQLKEPPDKFSRYLKSESVQLNGFHECMKTDFGAEKKLVQIIAYCLMPTHVHLVLKQLTDSGLSIYMGNVLNSYARYFNTKHQRKGPLWESRFKNVRVTSDDQLLHLTRYVHLNPVTAHLAEDAGEWEASSYSEYLSKNAEDHRICSFEELIDVEPIEYKKFVKERIPQQRVLALIKNSIEMTKMSTPGVDIG